MLEVRRLPQSVQPGLPNLPVSSNTVANNLGDGLRGADTAADRAALAAALKRRGIVTDAMTPKQSDALVDWMFEKIGPQLEQIREANNGGLEDFIVNRLVDKDVFEAQNKKALRRAKIWAGIGTVGGLALSGLVNIGFQQGIHHLPSWLPGWLTSNAQSFAGPFVFMLSGMVVGAFTSLGVEMLTTPMNAWWTRLVFALAPIKSHLDDLLGRSLVSAYNASNQIDGRIFTAAATLGSLITNLCTTIDGAGGVSALIREARKSGSDKAALLTEAGERLGGKLIATEVTSFHIDPMFTEIMQIVHAACGASFERLDDADKTTLIDTAIDFIKKKRPAEADSQRPSTDTAIESYFKPFLNMLINGRPKAMAA